MSGIMRSVQRQAVVLAIQDGIKKSFFASE